VGDASKIEWTDATWNPIAGCSPVSPGCTHCYAATMARRLAAMGQAKYAGTAERRGKVDVFTGVLRFDEAALEQPLRWKKPRRIFVNSMSDLFHESIALDWPDRIEQVFDVMVRCPQHTFQVLTKRPELMSRFVNRWLLRQDGKESPPGTVKPLPNVWLGTSVEDQQRADERIPWLLKTPAAVRFLSCEPLLGPVACGQWLVASEEPPGHGPLTTGHRLHWVIAGGESGHQARPMHPEWARGLRDQCQAAGVPFFFKQWGEWRPWVGMNLDQIRKPAMSMTPDGRTSRGKEPMLEGGELLSCCGKKVAGRTLDGREWSEFPLTEAGS
jgi:protein gp37